MSVLPVRSVRTLFGCAILVLLAACQTSRYQMDKDAGPSGEFDASSVPDAVPVYEVRTIAGNKSPYTVNGRTYDVLADSTGYRESGLASWYGRKFHGYHTSNGEVYNMYGMTAAHKTLPIPSYVRVTNLDNGREVVVRVNDRGPFHDARIIDLSYAAAQKLGYAERGTVRVSVEALPMPAAGETVGAAGGMVPGTFYLQLGAFSSIETARQFQQRVASTISVEASIQERSNDGRAVYRVRLGPFDDKRAAESMRYRLMEAKFPEPLLLNESG